MAFRNFQLKIKAKTWRRDSYGLFDYETANCNRQSLSSSRPGKLNRTNHQISYSNTNPYSDKQVHRKTELGPEESLINIIESPEGIKIITESTNDDESNQLWTVVERGENARGYALQTNDVIKLGRVKFRITQIKVVNENETKRGNRKSIIDSIRDHMQNVQEPFLIDPKAQTNKGSNAGNMCKICLYDKSEEEDDPLISPCKCIGSVKYVHLKCMQNWVKSKLNMQQNKNIITILWKNLNCELCKEKLPITLRHEGEDLSLIPFDNNIAGSYVMMESFSKERDSTGIHLIDLSSNQNFKIGRGHDCDLKISDISVSRLHAMFVVSKGKIYLRDNNSKFGTLVLKKDPVLLNSDYRKSPLFQCGRTLLRFSLKKPWIAYLPCFGAFFAPCQSSQSRNEPINKESLGINEADDETMIRFASEDEIKREGRASV